MAKIALLIGVSEYGTGLSPLPGSALDVDAMQRVLVHPEMGGFAAIDIKVLKNPQRQAMVEEIYWLFNDRKKNDLLLFYFSGHGIKDEYANYYLATRDTRKENDRLYQPSAVRATDLHEFMENSGSHYQVIILDACFSGAFPKGMTVKDDGIVNLQKALGGKGRAILTSSGSVEYSFSAEANSYEEIKLSVYTRYLVEGIETGAADTDDDGAISVKELHEYASSRVREVAPGMTPRFSPVEEGYKIILAKSLKYNPKRRYTEALEKVIRGGEISFIDRTSLNELRTRLGLEQTETKIIEDELLELYRKEFQEKLQKYKQTFSTLYKLNELISESVRANLICLQRQLDLRDGEVKYLEEEVALKSKYKNLEVEYEKLKNEKLMAFLSSITAKQNNLKENFEYSERLLSFQSIIPLFEPLENTSPQVQPPQVQPQHRKETIKLQTPQSNFVQPLKFALPSIQSQQIKIVPWMRLLSIFLIWTSISFLLLTEKFSFSNPSTPPAKNLMWAFWILIAVVLAGFEAFSDSTIKKNLVWIWEISLLLLLVLYLSFLGAKDVGWTFIGLSGDFEISVALFSTFVLFGTLQCFAISGGKVRIFFGADSSFMTLIGISWSGLVSGWVTNMISLILQ